MIDKTQIEKLANEVLTGDQFLVNVTVSSSNIIHVMVDSDTSVSINQLVEISRFIENALDRDVEDFELSVFSAGLTEPLRLVRQYKKNLGKELEVLLTNGSKMSGVVKDASENAVSLEVTTKEKTEGSKRKVLVTQVHVLDYSEIKEAKKIIKF